MGAGTKKTRADDLSLWERVKQSVKPLDARQKNRADNVAPKQARPAKKKTFEQQVGTGSNGPQQGLAPALRTPPIRHQKKQQPAPTKLDRKQVRRVNRGKEPIEARLDLHGYQAATAHNALVGFIRNASAGGMKWVLVVTGKGLRGEGVLRREVPAWLRSPELAPLVVGFEEAAPHQGGGGALYVRLRKTP